MNRTKLFDLTAVLAICFIMLSYATITLFPGQRQWMYPVCGILGMTVAAICVLRRALWTFYDAFLLCTFLGISMISACIWGIDPIAFLCSRFFSFWMICLSMYYVIQNVSDAKRYIGIFFFFAAFLLCLISIYALIHASSSILAHVINEVEKKGCFSGGRLYAYGCYVVDIPARGDDGRLVVEQALLPVSKEVNVGFLPMTSTNVLKQAFKFLGRI